VRTAAGKQCLFVACRFASAAPSGLIACHAGVQLGKVVQALVMNTVSEMPYLQRAAAKHAQLLTCSVLPGRATCV
jgi:hypothetical protein